jgi:hypothetical protein
MWGYIGEVEGEDLLLGHLETARRYLYPHLHFSIGYNVDQVRGVFRLAQVGIDVGSRSRLSFCLPPLCSPRRDTSGTLSDREREREHQPPAQGGYH